MRSNTEPHPSHRMGEWESTIVQLANTPRYGDVRTCVNCGYEQARTVAGTAIENELIYPCADIPKDGHG